MRDPYAVLGVRQDAREDEIKAAWRARVKSVHPDHNRDDPQAAARFAEVGAAYDLLRDPKKRNRYDQRHRGKGEEDGQTIMQKRQAAKEAAERAKAAREEAARVMEELARANAQRAAKAAQESAAATGPETPAGESPESVVNRIFGSGGEQTGAKAQTNTSSAQPQGASAKPQGSGQAQGAGGSTAAQSETTQKPTEEGEASRAGTVPLPVQAVELISYWIRKLRGIEPVPEKAPDIVTEAVVSIDDLIVGRTVPVALFDGREVRVRLEPGMTDGHVVRLEAQGHRFQGMQRGDVRVMLKVADDPRFEVEGFDIHTVLPVSLENAVLGCDSTVEAPEGAVAITIPPWSDSNRSIRIEGKGLPEAPGKRGDLVVELRLLLWEKPDDKVTDLMRLMREGLYI